MAYALFNLQERGRLFVGHNTDVYEGMVIGIHARGNDLAVNPLKTCSSPTFAPRAGPTSFWCRRSTTLEFSLEFINEDELVEVTPKSIRIPRSC